MPIRTVPVSLVIHWRCPDCQEDNYFHGRTPSPETLADDEVAQAMISLGVVDPEDLAVIPERMFCRRCEEQFRPDLEEPPG